MPDTETLARLAQNTVQTDQDVVDLVRALLEQALRRQCWVFFLAADAAPVQLLVPISDLPYEPDDDTDHFGAFVADTLEQVGGTQVVIAWERPGTTSLFPVDWAWIDAVACVLAEHGVSLRGQVLVHAEGATFIELHDQEAA